MQHQEDELLKLGEEVKHLKDVNEEKEFELQDVSKEYEKLKVKLDSIEDKKLRNEEIVTLEDILYVSRNVKWKECDKGFVSQ